MPDDFSVGDMEKLKRRAAQGVEAAGYPSSGGGRATAAAEHGMIPFTHVGLPTAEGVDLLKHVRVLLRRWIWIALALAVSVGAGLAYIEWCPRTYATSGQYRVDTPGMLILEGSTNRSQLQRIAELIRSQEVLQRVSSQTGGDLGWRRLRGILSTSPHADAGFLTLRASARRPDRLQEVVEVTARVFNAYVQEEQYDKRRAHLTESIQKKKKLLDLIQDRGKRIGQLDLIEKSLQAATLSLTTERELLKRIDAQLDIVGRAKPLSSAAALRLIEEETARSKIKQHELSKRYTSEHPKMRELKMQIEALNELRDAYTSETEQAKPSLNAERLSGLRFQKVLYCEKLDRQRIGFEGQRTEAEKKRKEIEEAIAAAEQEVRFLGLVVEEGAEEEGRAPAPGSLPVTPEALSKSLASDLERLNRAAQERGHNVLVPVRAPAPAAQIWPKRTGILILCLMAGLAAGVALVLLVNSLDDRILAPTTVVRGLGLNLLVIAPRFREVRERLIDPESPSSTLAEIFGILRNNIRYTSETNPQKLLLISSAQQGEGKSTVAANLALSYQLEGNSVLLVDADLRRPTGHRLLEGLLRGPEGQPGLRQWLEGEIDESAEAIHGTSVESLYVMPAGGRARNPAKLLGSARMEQLLAGIQNEFDVVIIDGPAVLPVVDATVISNQVRGVLLVVSARESRLPSVRHAMGRLYHVGSPIIGAILNKFEGSSSVYSRYYGYGYRGYRYSYSPYRET